MTTSLPPGGSLPPGTPSSTGPTERPTKSSWGDRSVEQQKSGGTIPLPGSSSKPDPTFKMPPVSTPQNNKHDDDWDDDWGNGDENTPSSTTSAITAKQVTNETPGVKASRVDNIQNDSDPEVAKLHENFKTLEKKANPPAKPKTDLAHLFDPNTFNSSSNKAVKKPKPTQLTSLQADEGSEVYRWATSDPKGPSVIIKPNAPAKPGEANSFQQTRAERGQAAYQIASLAGLKGVVVPAINQTMTSFTPPDLQKDSSWRKGKRVQIKGREYTVKQNLSLSASNVPCLVQKALKINSKQIWDKTINENQLIDQVIFQMITASADAKLAQGDANFNPFELEADTIGLMFFDTDECFPAENESKSSEAVHKPGYLSLKQTRVPLKPEQRSYMVSKLLALESTKPQIVQAAKDNGLSDDEISALKERLDRLIAFGKKAQTENTSYTLQDVVFTTLPQVKSDWEECSRLIVQGVRPGSELHIRNVAHLVGDVIGKEYVKKAIRSSLIRTLNENETNKILKALEEIKPPYIALESFYDPEGQASAKIRANGLLDLVNQRDALKAQNKSTNAIDQQIIDYVKYKPHKNE